MLWSTGSSQTPAVCSAALFTNCVGSGSKTALSGAEQIALHNHPREHTCALMPLTAMLKILENTPNSAPQRAVRPPNQCLMIQRKRHTRLRLQKSGSSHRMQQKINISFTQTVVIKSHVDLPFVDTRRRERIGAGPTPVTLVPDRVIPGSLSSFRHPATMKT